MHIQFHNVTTNDPHFFHCSYTCNTSLLEWFFSSWDYHKSKTYLSYSEPLHTKYFSKGNVHHLSLSMPHNIHAHWTWHCQTLPHTVWVLSPCDTRGQNIIQWIYWLQFPIMKIPNEPGISRERWPFILILYVRVIEASLSVASAYNLRYIFFRLIPTECLRTYQLKKKKKRWGMGNFVFS